MITWQNFDFLQQFFWSQKLPHPPKTKSHGMRMQYFPTVNILLGTLNGRLYFKHKTQLLIMHGPRHKRLKSRQIE